MTVIQLLIMAICGSEWAAVLHVWEGDKTRQKAVKGRSAVNRNRSGYTTAVTRLQKFVTVGCLLRTLLNMIKLFVFIFQPCMKTDAIQYI